jgi:hypothetical protein
VTARTRFTPGATQTHGSSANPRACAAARLQQRDTLLALFWPERDAERAHHHCAGAIYFLRTELGDSLLVARGGNEIGVKQARSGAMRWTGSRVRAGRWEDAVKLYAGELLPGFHVADAPGFELARARAQSPQEQAAGCAGRAFEQAARGDLAAAIEWARKATALAHRRSGDPPSHVGAGTHRRSSSGTARVREFLQSPGARVRVDAVGQSRSLAESIRQSNGTLNTSARAIHSRQTPNSSAGEIEVDAAAALSRQFACVYRLAAALVAARWSWWWPPATLAYGRDPCA